MTIAPMISSAGGRGVTVEKNGGTYAGSVNRVQSAPEMETESTFLAVPSVLINLHQSCASCRASSTAPGISRGHQGAVHRLYPIVFLGDTLTESRMIVPRDHPAGAPVAGQYHQEGACGLCQPLIASGIFRVAKSSPPMLLKVTYTSQSTQTSSQWGCSNASSSSAEPSTGLEAHEITIDLTAAQRLSLVTWPLFAKDLCIVSFTYSIF
jgi:hypothetical protein